MHSFIKIGERESDEYEKNTFIITLFGDDIHGSTHNGDC